MSLTLYYDLLSQPSRALFIFCKITKIPFVDKAVNLGRAEHHSQNFEKINPFRKVPSIEHGDFRLTESIAILRYLCRENKIPDHWYPKDSEKQAKIDEYLEWQHLDVRFHCAMYFKIKYWKPAKTGILATPEKVAEYEARMVKCLDLLNDVWLKNTPYLAGEQITIADIVGACELEQTRIAGYDPCQGRPQLTTWLNRVRSELHPHYGVAHAGLNSLVEMYKGEPPLDSQN